MILPGRVMDAVTGRLLALWSTPCASYSKSYIIVSPLGKQLEHLVREP